jgi:predicted Zn-dependent protease
VDWVVAAELIQFWEHAFPCYSPGIGTAVVLFKLNTKAYPDFANAWDRLGDGYEATNNIQDARMAYALSVELNPDNEHAKGELVKLRK